MKIKNIIFYLLLLLSFNCVAGNQQYEELKADTRNLLNKMITEVAPNISSFKTLEEETLWVNSKIQKIKNSKRIQKFNNDYEAIDFLKSVHYEASRAGLDPELVLGLIEVESGFKKYALSSVGARGYMQVMPFWVKTIGTNEHNLFNLRTNLRYGCTILRHYLTIEKGDMFRALGRYNGSLGKAEYPNAVFSAYNRNWKGI